MANDVLASAQDKADGIQGAVASKAAIPSVEK